MSFWKKVFTAAFLTVLCTQNSFAVVDFSQQKDNKGIIVTGFTDFPPFGEAFYKETRHGIEIDYYDNKILEGFIKDFLQDLNVAATFQYRDKAYEDTVRDVRTGKIDVLLGMYYGTKLYDGLDYIIPAVINNPVTVMMLPTRINEIKNTEDLKKLKGGILAKEHFSDYVSSEIKKFPVKKFDKPYDLFKQLFAGEIDYIFSGYYTGVIESSKLGLRSKIAFSKRAIWDMPLFIGVSKASKYHSFLVQRLTKFTDNKENIAKINQQLNQAIAEYEAESLRTVPPIFVNE